MPDHIASRVVVGIDGSPQSEEAAAFAVHLARALDGRVTRAHAVARGPHRPGPHRRSPRCGRAEAVLAAVADRHRGQVELDTVVLPAASPVLALHDLLRREAATLLVVGASHIGAAGRMLGAGTAERLARHAPCPVVVVPPGWSRTFELSPRTIGAGVDGTRQSHAALEQAVAVALAWPARLRVISVWNADEYPVGMPFAPTVGVVGETLEREARAALDDVVGALPDDVRAQGIMPAGGAVRELVAHSTGLALLVVGSRGYGPLRSVVLGGVSGALIRRAACPVMVVPREASSPASRSTAEATGGLSDRPGEKSPPSIA
jgi:nucleotide-binding universal stress UspA family protein